MDATAFGAEMVALVKDFLENEIDPLRQKIAALEQQITSVPTPRDPDVAEVAKAAGQIVRADVDELLRDVLKTGDGEAMIAKAVQSIPAPLTEENVKAIVGDAIAGIPTAPTEDHLVSRAAERILPEIKELRSAVEALPPAPELPDIPAMISDAIKKMPTDEDLGAVKSDVESLRNAMAEVPKPEPVTLPDFSTLISAEVEKAISAIEKPKDGHSPKLEEYTAYLDEAVQKAVSAVPAPKDGVNLAGAIIDRQGSLILTLSDGSTRDLGKVVGKDADPVDMDAVERSIVEKVAAIPVPKDGVDGVGFDDMNCELRDDGVYLVWEKGDVIKEARLPVPIYRGVWKDGTYHKGDTVTWGGSTWIAESDPSGKPDAPDSGWRLSVKKGRDGRDGLLKEQKPAGPVKVG